ncbi:hypothetical protein [Pseudoduganella armeniaca]|uniref:PilN domain-containing protein n=1 Tax=Pseudoduganella armeniaca TaxID=2072590 RepID=A0A2R4C6K0_9BURK|nr:hypothetical protein [Pseudoduganella armeniaca]AVR95257.1 hypothetical protein C9I28_05605 [Pseudoduganella armeniaca]
MRRTEDLLAPRPRHRALAWLLAGALAAAAVQVAADAWSQLQLADHERTVLERLRVAAHRPPPAAPSREEKDQAKRWAALQVERGFRWYPVFQGLEKASSDDIELLEFAPDKVNRTFVLHGEARDVSALLAYVAQLSAQPAFVDVYLSHQKVTRRDALATQAFEIRGRVRD